MVDRIGVTVSDCNGVSIGCSLPVGGGDPTVEGTIGFVQGGDDWDIQWRSSGFRGMGRFDDNEAVVQAAPLPPPPGDNIEPVAPAPNSAANDDDEPPSSPHQGQLIMDASCTPADIRS
jgi:hypothetical protein